MYKCEHISLHFTKKEYEMMYFIIPQKGDIQSTLPERVELSTKILQGLLERAEDKMSNFPIHADWIKSKLARVKLDKQAEIDNLIHNLSIEPHERVYQTARWILELYDEEEFAEAELLRKNYEVDFKRAIKAYEKGDKKEMMIIFMHMYKDMGAAAPIDFSDERFQDIEIV